MRPATTVEVITETVIYLRVLRRRSSAPNRLFIMNGIVIAAILLRQIHLGLPETEILVMKGVAPEVFDHAEQLHSLAKNHFAL